MSAATAYIQAPTYTNLMEVIKVYLNRYDEDTLNIMPMFINGAEKTILRELRMPSMMKTVSFTVGTYGDTEEGFIDLPRDYLEMCYVWTKNKGTLQRISFDELMRIKYQDRKHAYEDVEREVPAAWAINGMRMYIIPVEPDREIFMTYYADIPELSEKQDGNILLKLAPDAMMYLSVAEGFRFLMEEEKAEYWEQQGFKRLNQIMGQVERAEWSGSPLTISPAIR